VEQFLLPQCARNMLVTLLVASLQIYLLLLEQH